MQQKLAILLVENADIRCVTMWGDRDIQAREHNILCWAFRNDRGNFGSVRIHHVR